MARPVQFRPEDILAAAREVFLERGIRATTAEVATRAGVSEGTVFKRFHSKFELFQAAMGGFLKEPTWIAGLPARVGRGEIQQEMVELGLEIIGFFRTIMPLMMLSWSNPSLKGAPSFYDQPNPPPVRALREMAGYFEAEMRAGRLRRQDAEVVARAFIGGLSHYVFTEVLLRASDELPLPPELYVRGFVQLLFKGLEV